MGGLFIAFGVPQLALTLFGGVAADRLPRSAVVAASLALLAAEHLVVGLLALTGRSEYWMLVVSAVAGGTIVAFLIPARTALVGDLVDERSLGNAVALQQVSFNAARVFAPATTGALIAVQAVGVGGTYLLASACFLASALVMLRLPRIARATVRDRRD